MLLKCHDITLYVEDDVAIYTSYEISSGRHYELLVPCVCTLCSLCMCFVFAVYVLCVVPYTVDDILKSDNQGRS